MGESHPDTIQAMCGLSDHYYQLERYQACIPLRKRILEARVKAQGAHSRAWSLPWRNSPWLTPKLGDDAEALPLMQQAYDIRREFFGEKNSRTQEAKERLAAIQRHLQGTSE